jgi:hypothetical protein
MQPHVTTLERAFQLARSGACENAEAIRRQLAKEGYDARHIEGRAIIKQLHELIDGTPAKGKRLLRDRQRRKRGVTLKLPQN